MSIEPTCEYCGVSDKFRCHYFHESVDCQVRRYCTYKPEPEKGTKLAKAKTEITLRMDADAGEFEKIEIASHHDNDPELVRIQQGQAAIVLSTEDIDTLIDSLNAVVEHLE